MDPNSFGYNYQTPDSSYKTGEDIVKYLVDTVSKNGNFLLDIGPKNDGTIPQIMQTGLRDAGTWIHAHSESIFNTTYWATTPGSDPFRYTMTANAFYIHINSKPSTKVIINDPIPYLPGDTVTVVGGSKNGAVVTLDWNNGNGTYLFSLSDEIIAADQYVWTFKLAYTSDW
jgi:alpha-L-fucosidase